MNDIKLLIVEDEFLCRQNLININWASIGVTVSGVAQNGDEAVELAKELRPDIVISDIEMPKKSGLELAQFLSTIMPEIKIIILTAYTKFEYVQEAVSLGIYQYILKPFEDAALLETVRSAVDELEAEHQKSMEYENISRQLENSKYFLRSYFFGSISEDTMYQNEFFSIFSDLDISGKYVSMVISLQPQESDNAFSGNYKIFKNIIKIISKYQINVISFFDITKLTFLFFSDKERSDTEINGRIFTIAEAIEEYLKFCQNINYVIGIGKCVTTLKNAPLSYNGAASALNYSFYLGFNTIICISDVEPRQSSTDYDALYNDGFLDYVKVGNADMALLLIKKLFYRFRENHEEITDVQRICSEILVRLSMCLLQCGQNPNILFDKTDVWSIIRKYNDVNNLEKFLTNIVEVTISHISFSRNSKNKTLIEKIKKYINDLPETTLNDISEHFYHSPNYLSNIFSKETGTTIKNYIIQVRIETSKKLLSETNKSIYEIANEVGYKNQQHFSILFKKIVGVSPSVYQLNSHQNDSDADQ